MAGEGAGGGGGARGPSMVAAHGARMEAERKEAARAALAALAPEGVGEPARQAALAAAGGDVEQAAALLKGFAASDLFERPPAPEKSGGQGEAGRGDGGAPSRAEIPTRSEGGCGGRRRREGGGDEGEGEGRERGRRRRKRSRRGREGGDGGDSGDGVAAAPRRPFLKESDLEAKRPEFVTWAREIKGIDVDNLPSRGERELFRTFAEDFNTGQLRHPKHYDLEAWRQKEAVERAVVAAASDEEMEVFDDEARRRAELAEARKAGEASRVAEAKRNLVVTGKADMLREQERLLGRQRLAYQTGDVRGARQMADLLTGARQIGALGPDANVEWDPKTKTYVKKK